MSTPVSLGDPENDHAGIRARSARLGEREKCGTASRNFVVGITPFSYALILFAWMMTNASPADDTGAVAKQPIAMVLLSAIAAHHRRSRCGLVGRTSDGETRSTIRLLLGADSDPVRCAIRELVEESQAITVTGEARNCHELGLPLARSRTQARCRLDGVGDAG